MRGVGPRFASASQEWLSASSPPDAVSSSLARPSPCMPSMGSVPGPSDRWGRPPLASRRDSGRPNPRGSLAFRSRGTPIPERRRCTWVSIHPRMPQRMMRTICADAATDHRPRSHPGQSHRRTRPERMRHAYATPSRNGTGLAPARFALLRVTPRLIRLTGQAESERISPHWSKPMPEGEPR